MKPHVKLYVSLQYSISYLPLYVLMFNTQLLHYSLALACVCVTNCVNWEKFVLTVSNLPKGNTEEERLSG